MKNIFHYSLFPVLCSLLIAACAGGAKPAASGSKTLDQAIAEAAAEIEERFTAGSKIAVLNFNSASDQFSEYVIDEITANLVSNRLLTVVDRKEVDLIRSEFEFQFSGEVSDDSMQEMGRMLGAQAIVSGSLQNIGGSYRIVIRALNVQTAIVEVQYRTDIAGDSRVQALLGGGTSTASGGRSQTETAGGGQAQAAAGGTAAPAAANIANGTYTFFPRPRSMREGRDSTVYLDRIEVRGGYFTVYYETVPVGVGRESMKGYTLFQGPNPTAFIYNLDQPNRQPLTAVRADSVQYEFFSVFNNHNVRRFRYELQFVGTNDAPWIFEEITIGEPDE